MERLLSSSRSPKLPNRGLRYLKTFRRLPLATYLTDYHKLTIEFSSYKRWANITPYTSYYYFAKCCVFVKQSSFLILFQICHLNIIGIHIESWTINRIFRLKFYNFKHRCIPKLPIIIFSTLTPKSQVQFAEFLKYYYFNRFSILYLSICGDFSTEKFQIFQSIS